jgi:2-keto-4-pentenoate hydratase/2-oxohepta-3-ene-1,7-dioic acid hydratase in catechol pathway
MRVRWISFVRSGGLGTGLVIGDTVHVVRPSITLHSLLGDDGEALQLAGEVAERDPAEIVPLAGLTLLPPIVDPPSLRDFYAFESHARAGRRNGGQDLPSAWFEIPVFYFGNTGSLIGHDAPVEAAPGSAMMDYEAEVAAIIGMGGRNLSPEQARRHIVGYTILNDWSARDLQRKEMKVGLGPAKGKDFASTLGPCLVTADELEPFRKAAAFDLAITATVDGVEYTRGNLADIYWSFEEMVSFASRGAAMRPGDILGCGTCGSGCIFELAQTHGAERFAWLQPGNRVEVSVDHLGTIGNTLHAGPVPHPLRPEN